MCGIVLESFEDFVRQSRRGEGPVPMVLFFPMHRIERIELDRSAGAIPSLRERFRQQSGADPETIFQAVPAEVRP